MLTPAQEFHDCPNCKGGPVKHVGEEEGERIYQCNSCRFMVSESALLAQGLKVSRRR